MTAPIAESELDAAQAWIAGDPDPETRAELQALLTAGDASELRERMSRSLEFGTAGLRGIVGAGKNRMNRAVIIRTTRALADYLLEHVVDSRTLPVVLGYDARLSSRAFAADAAGVLVAAGLPVRFFEAPVPTPLVAYAARDLAASAGIVITASHNPPEYNGYKVYASNAVQIVSPLDHAIAERIERVGPARTVPRSEGVLDGAHPRAESIPDALFERYLAELALVVPHGAVSRELSIVYTPLHGVGWQYARRALATYGFESVHVVAEQMAPDGRFPTVRFPNPEEPGALDLALALASERNADLVLANDPDADRLAACSPTPSGRWVPLTGNQIGVLLADFLLERAARTPEPLVVSSVVSSPMLGSIAARHGARWEQTLTGFKWICNAALELEREQGVRFVFGYEEALGYCAGHLVRDKDGISAAVALAELAATLRADGKSLLDRLAELYREHGLWVSVQHNVVRPGSEGAAEISRAMLALASAPPRELAGTPVNRVTDYTAGAEMRPRWLGETSLVTLELEGGARVLVRPSGTEPKLKIYVDLAVSVQSHETIAAREQEALAQAKTLATSAALALGFS